MRRIPVLAMLCALTLAACASSNTQAGSPGTTTAPSSAITGITIPDSYTALTLVPISSPTFPFLGSDQKYHIVYDLLLTNASRVPATLDKIDVVDAATPTNVIASLSGKALVDPDCPVGNCNRLRALPATAVTDAAIPPQESRALYVDFTLDTLAQAPKAVLHHLYGKGAAGPPAKEPTAIDYLTTPFDVSSGTPRVIGPPVKGKNWIALNGCCEPGYAHRSSLASTNGRIRNSQRFAIDWKQANDKGDFYTGDRTKNESYVDYGSDIYAVADGTITATLDDVDPGAPGTLPAKDPVLGPKLTVKNVDGNHIVQDLGGGVYALYAHLLKGTLLVKPGGKVKKGDRIAKLGNTGNSNASHMHFHLMNHPSLLEGDGLPYVIDSFTYYGLVPADLMATTDDYLSGNFLAAKQAAGQPRKDQLPMALAIVDFPSP